MTKYEKAKRWRERLKLTPRQLSALTGYSYEAVLLYERGHTSRKTWSNRKEVYEQRPIDPYVWQRWQLVCAAVDQQLKSGKEFEW